MKKQYYEAIREKDGWLNQTAVKHDYEPDDLVDWIDFQNKIREKKGLPPIEVEKEEKKAPRRRGNYFNIDKIKNIPIADVVERFGGELVPRGNKYQLHCILPSHPSKSKGQTDRNMSACVYPDTNKYFCYAEGISLSVTDLAGVMSGMSLEEAKDRSSFMKECEILSDLMGLSKNDVGGTRDSEFTGSDLEFIGIKYSRRRIEIPEMNVKMNINAKEYLGLSTYYYFIASKALDKLTAIRDYKREFWSFHEGDKSDETTMLWYELLADEERASRIVDKAQSKLAILAKKEDSGQEIEEETER